MLAGSLTVDVCAGCFPAFSLEAKSWAAVGETLLFTAKARLAVQFYLESGYGGEAAAFCEGRPSP